nr:hypothetical protein [Corynebacterium lactis]
MNMFPDRPWKWVVYIGVIGQLVLSMMLFTGDYSQAPSAVARDVFIAAGVGAVGALALSVCIPLVESMRRARLVMVGLVAIVVLIKLFAVAAQALTAWVAIPGVVMAIGVLLMYRDVRASSDGSLKKTE